MALSDSLQSLKGFDINELDFNEAGSWPWPIKAFALVLTFGLLMFGGYWFLIKDQYQTLDQVTGEEAKLKQQYESKAHRVANLEAYRIQMEEMEQTFGSLLKQLPADTEVPELLEDITSTGLGSGLEIESIQLRSEEIKEFYVELPIAISVSGHYHDLASFVSGVASLPRIVTLHDFQLSVKKKDVDSVAGPILKLEITAKTYRYNENAGKSGKRKKKQKRKRGKA